MDVIAALIEHGVYGAITVAILGVIFAKRDRWYDEPPKPKKKPPIIF